MNILSSHIAQRIWDTNNMHLNLFVYNHGDCYFIVPLLLALAHTNICAVAHSLQRIADAEYAAAPAAALTVMWMS